MSIYEQFIARLIAANDETQTEASHNQFVLELYAWKDGVRAAFRYIGRPEPDLNGDYHYMDLGVNRPMCCGLFLDWNNPDFETEQEKRERYTDEPQKQAHVLRNEAIERVMDLRGPGER